jgi:hypothetical protein
MHWDELQVSPTSQPDKRAENVKDRHESDAWVWDVFQQQDTRRKARSGNWKVVKRCELEHVHPVHLPGGCLLYRLPLGKRTCAR